MATGSPSSSVTFGAAPNTHDLLLLGCSRSSPAPSRPSVRTADVEGLAEIAERLTLRSGECI